MTQETILKMGHPLLYQTALPCDLNQLDQLTETIEKMIVAMRDYQGVGIAAPQIGVNRRVFIYEVNNNKRYPNQAPIPLTVVINPAISIVDHTQEEGLEKCLSVPNLGAHIPRYRQLTLSGYHQDGQPFSKKVEGFEARIVQHEIDHLDGRLFPSRIRDFTSFFFVDENAS